MATDLYSIIIYWGAVLISSLFCRIYENLSRDRLWEDIFFAALIAFPLSYVAGRRYGVGADWDNYRFFFENWELGLLNVDMEEHYEIGFTILARICGLITPNYEFFFFICEFLSLFFPILAFMKVKDKLSVTYAFILFYFLFYHHSLNIVRQVLAIGLITYSIPYIIEKKYFKFLICLIFACLFHSTAIICISFPFVALLFSGKFSEHGYIKGSSHIKLYLISIMSLFLIMGFLLSVIMGFGFMGKYSDAYLIDSGASVGIGRLAEFCVLMLPSVLSAPVMIQNDKYLAILRDISILFIPFSLVGYYVPWGGRLFFYAETAFVFFFPILLKRFPSKKGSSMYSMIIMFLLYIWTFLIKNESGSFPYQGF